MAGQKAQSSKRTISRTTPTPGAKTKARANGKPTSVQWAALKEEWVTTGISLASLAAKYEIPFNDVKQTYYRHNWKESLRKYTEAVNEEMDKVIMEKAREVGRRSAVLDEHVLFASEKIVALVEKKLEQVEKARDLTKLKSIAHIMKTASEALKNAQHNIRLAVDRSTDISDSKGATRMEELLSEEEQQRIEEELFSGQASQPGNGKSKEAQN